MAFTTTHTSPTYPAKRSPRARVALALISSAEPTNEPDAEEESAAQFVADVTALTEAGLIVPVEQHGAVRYAVTDPDGPAA